MKFDAALMENMISKTEERMVEAWNTYSSYDDLINNTSSQLWDDSRKEELKKLSSEVKENLISSVQCMNDYLSYLKSKVAELKSGM